MYQVQGVWGRYKGYKTGMRQVQRVHCVNEPVCVIFTLLRYFAFAFFTIASITFENANADVNPKCEWVLMIPISCLTKGGTVANTKYTKI